MVKYTCEKCGRDFTQKTHFTRHNTKKNPCIQESKLNEIISEKVKNAIEKQDNIDHKKKLGQYFTISDNLQQFVFDKVQNKGSLLLEPSFGAGHLLKKFKELDNNYPIICYELDSSVKKTIDFNEYQTPIYGDFTEQTITKKFKTIVGNPPYVKQSTGNLYIKFIEICYGLLASGGELIFIVPSDFIKLTSASALIDTMNKYGSFTDFLFPHDEKLFEGASIDVLVFRYEKDLFTNETSVNDTKMICNVNNGIITFSSSEVKGTPLSDIFNVYVGLVSGRDEIYKVPFGNIEVLNDKERIDKYIFTNIFPTNNEEINAHLKKHKAALMERKIKKFTENNWFEWGAPRNIKAIEENLGKRCIYIQNITRKQEVAFIDKVQYFGGGLLCLMPKVQITDIQLKNILDFLNSNDFQKDYIYSKRFKIGHKQISSVIIPS